MIWNHGERIGGIPANSSTCPLSPTSYSPGIVLAWTPCPARALLYDAAVWYKLHAAHVSLVHPPRFQQPLLNMQEAGSRRLTL